MEFWERFCDAPASPELVKGMGRVERICEIVQPFFYLKYWPQRRITGKARNLSLFLAQNHFLFCGTLYAVLKVRLCPFLKQKALLHSTLCFK